ncbi:MAG: O-antigen ligase family protein [Ignavibacteriaceae bacterium]|nr:O-antigen ligase family protein [Ignavibacteria bacterium]NNJ53364.1 O-antigen ligase family protein [Ignavibacteriaceae bacterium]NNL21621.1 O-antigen ligase family protein [Ignavibacteriaceae bacterium]
MSESSSRPVKILDILTYIFFTIFLLSLGNSIFANQVGFFGALFFILIRIAITRKNQFYKTGLELPFLLYILAETLSLIFSEYPSEAFRNLTKRFAVILVFYTTIAAVTNLKWGKRYFYIYLGGMLATISVYLFFSAEHYLNNLYGTVQSGPSVFQFPITTSEIISFTVIFLFAFLINEKTSLRVKLFTLAGFLISSAALIATFKRTGWIGAMFGIVLILILTKKWKALTAAVIVAALLFVIESNKSEVLIFNTGEDKLEKIHSFETEGRAYNFTTIDSMIVVVDFDNGLLFFKDDRFVKNVKLTAPIGSITHLKDDYHIASLYDTRFIVLKRNGLKFTEVNELLSPGYTKVFKIENEMLYVLDADSGLTVFTNPIKSDKHRRFPELKFADNIFIDSSKFYIDYDRGLQIRELNNFIPSEKINRELDGSFKILKTENGRILISKSNKVELLDLNFNMIDSVTIGSYVKQIVRDKDNIYLLTAENDILKLTNPFNDSLKVLNKYNLAFTPRTLFANDNKIYTSIVIRSRLMSIFDPYVQTNFSRLALWRAGWEMFKNNPIFGLGDIDLAKYYLKYKRPIDKEIHGHLHNNYIHFLATLGLFGFLALTFLFVKMFMVMGSHFKATREKPFINSYALGAIAGLASMLTAGLTELNFWDQEITTLVYFTVGLSIALFKHYKA